MKLLIIFIFISLPVYSDDFISTILEENIEKNDHLYIKNAEDIKKLDTITYYFTASEPNDMLYDSFKQFSKDIGKRDGAIYIPLNNKSLEIFKNKNHKQDYMYNYAKNSSCDFSYVTSGSILFEIRDFSLKKIDRCILFPVKDNPLWLTSLLKKLNSNINNLKNSPNLNNLKKDSIITMLMNGIDVNIDKSTIEKNKPAIRRFVEWLSGLFSKKT
jgi:hypothetical protein